MRPTGHIRQRSSGSFEIRYSLGPDSATGKRRIATTTVKGNRRAAEKELRRLLRTLDTGEAMARSLACRSARGSQPQIARTLFGDSR
jgi:hypothetical protein